VIDPTAFSPTRSLAKRIRKADFELRIDADFLQVIDACQLRSGDEGTWITDDMQTAYTELHHRGLAHSVEIWAGASLMGGLYGVALGKVFFGESMFSSEDNTSKLALFYLVRQLQRWGYQLIDCQVSSEHLVSLGAGEISRELFQQCLRELLSVQQPPGSWQLDPDLVIFEPIP
jgi:leucyl/phenylalanyl-tRNA--protein transferase